MEVPLQVYVLNMNAFSEGRHKKTRLKAGFSVYGVKKISANFVLKTSLFNPDQLDPTIFRFAVFCSVIGNRLTFTVAFGNQSVADAFHFKVIHN